MLPENVLKAFRFICKFGYKIGALPFAWNSIENTIYRTTSRIRIYWSLFLSCYCLANFCFISIQWIQSACCMNISERLFQNGFNVISHCGGLVFYFNTYLCGMEVQIFIKQLIQDK